MAIDVDKLLAEIGPDAPCGEDLTYDPAYLELDRLAQGTPEQQVGSTIVEAQEPDWKAVREKALELLGRTKDLRVLMQLALAQLQLEGLPGLSAALAVLRGVLERYWESVWPQLDPDDNLDPMERMNIMASLSPSGDAYGDPMQFRQRVRMAPLASSRQLGRFGLRDIAIARGEVPFTGEGTPPEMPVIDAAFADTDKEELTAVATAAREAGQHVEAIDAVLTAKVGAGKAPDLSEFRKVLKEVEQTINERLGISAPAEGGQAAGEAAGAGEAAAGPAIAGEIRSPEDVIRVLDKIVDYYRRAEPSSPVPLLVNRAKKLVRKSFMEIIQDLTPESVRQIEVISGPAGEQAH